MISLFILLAIVDVSIGQPPPQQPSLPITYAAIDGCWIEPEKFFGPIE
jgi:hypothetical protein